MDPEIRSETDRIICHFGPFSALLPHIQSGDIYHSGDIITLYLCTINDNHMMYASRDMECDRQNVIFLSFWTVFCPLPPPPPNKLKNENFEK